MKICVLAQRVPYPPNKGEKLRTYYQIKRLKELGHDVHVLSFEEGPEDAKNAQELSQHLDIKVETEALGAKPLRYLWALLTSNPISVGAFYSPKMSTRLKDCIENNTDVLLLSASSLVSYVKRLYPNDNWPCKVMVDFMDVDSDKWRQYARSSRWPMRYVYNREANGIQKLERYANTYFEHCFLIAEEEVKLFAKTVSSDKPVTVLGNGMAFDAFYPSKEAPDLSNPHFLFAGVMDYKPNIDAVLWFYQHCWREIKTLLPTAKFVVAGMNPSSEILDLQKKDASLEVTGFVDDILPYFHRASVFVAPFRIARGVQNKVLQAAACQIPLVSTPMGAEGITFADESTMSICSESDTFVKSCIEAVRNREAVTVKADKAFNALQNEYGWEKQLKPMEEALEQNA